MQMGAKGAVPNRRLSGVDAAFLYLERKEIPLHIAGIFIADGPIPFERFLRSVESKLHFMPRCRQIVVAPPFNLGYPTWEDDPHFDIHRHIFRLNLESPGGQPELEALSGRILSPMMDRSKPLWDVHVIDGLEGGRGAMILRLHHALTDGISGVALAVKLFLDATPEGSAPARKRRARALRRPAPEMSLAAAITSGIRTSLDHLIDAEAGVVEFIETFLGDRSGFDDAAHLLPEVVGAVERLPFNKPCGGDRKFCWADFDFSEVQAIRAAAGGSVNDVVLTVLTRAIARYVQMHGQTIASRLIRIVCPVNMRRNGDDTTGNQITFLPVVLPMDLEDPVRMLQAVSARSAAMKKARAADFVALAASCLGVTPPFVQAMLWRGISDVMLPFPLLNMICTNLPGSPDPLYCAGRQITEFYPQVPTGYELGINCAVQSYCGKLFFGLIADAQVAPDVTSLRDFLYPCFDELCVATGVRKRARKTVASRKARRRQPNRAAVETAPAAAEAAPTEVAAPSPATPQPATTAGAGR